MFLNFHIIARCEAMWQSYVIFIAKASLKQGWVLVQYIFEKGIKKRVPFDTLGVFYYRSRMPAFSQASTVA